MKWLLLSLSCLFLGCATTTEKAEQLSAGMTSAEVGRRLGPPKAQIHYETEDVWRYRDDRGVCEIHFSDDITTNIDCSDVRRREGMKAMMFMQMGGFRSQPYQPQQAYQMQTHYQAPPPISTPAIQPQGTGSLASCGIRPLGSPSCQQQCMNGRWVEVCN